MRTFYGNRNSLSDLNIFRKINTTTLLLFIALILVQVLIKNNVAPHPNYNWDSLAYMALVLKLDGIENDSVRHDMVYDIAKNSMPEKYFKQNTENNNKYRIAVANDYKAFDEQLPLYSIKVLFVGLVYILYKSGVELFPATYLPSMISYFLIGWLVFFFLIYRSYSFLAFFVAVTCSLLPSGLHVSTMSSPDGIAAFFMSLGVVLILLNQSSRWASLFFLFAILCRPDNILFIVLLYSALILHDVLKHNKTIYRFIELIGFILIHFFIGYLCENPGWKDTFMQSFAYKHPYFLTAKHNFSWEIYWDIIDRVYVRLSNKSIGFILLGSLVLFGPMRKSIENYFWKLNFFQVVFLIIIAVNGFRFFLFPDIHDRFYYVYFILITLLIAETQRNHIPVDTEKTDY